MRIARIESTPNELPWYLDSQDQVNRNQVSSYEYPSFIVWRHHELKIQSVYIYNVAQIMHGSDLLADFTSSIQVSSIRTLVHRIYRQLWTWPTIAQTNDLSMRL
jgi:hypothetical protein